MNKTIRIAALAALTAAGNAAQSDSPDCPAGCPPQDVAATEQDSGGPVGTNLAYARRTTEAPADHVIAAQRAGAVDVSGNRACVPDRHARGRVADRGQDGS